MTEAKGISITKYRKQKAALLAAPPDQPAPTKETGSDEAKWLEIGATGIQSYSGFITEAYNAQLYWPTCEPLYERIRRSDPEITVIRQIFAALARAVSLEFELPDNPTPDDLKAQEFGEQILDDIEGGTTQLLENCVSQVPFKGWGWWECLPGLRDPDWVPPAAPGDEDDWRSQYDDGRIGIRRLAWRDQSTFNGWDLSSTGKLKGLKQNMPPGSPPPATRLIPLDQSLHIAYGDTNNPEGLASLEAIWRLERIKYGFEIISGIGFEHAAGFLNVKKTESGTLGDGEKALITKAARAVLTAQEGNYAYWPYGLEADVKDIGFQAAGNLLEFIKYYGILKYTIFNAQWVALSATTGAGSYSAMNDSSSMFLITYNAMMAGFVDQIDSQIIRRVFDWNGGAFPGMTKRPKLVATPIEKTISLAELGTFLSQIQWMKFSDEDLKAIRRISGFLPEALPEEGEGIDHEDGDEINPAAADKKTEPETTEPGSDEAINVLTEEIKRAADLLAAEQDAEGGQEKQGFSRWFGVGPGKKTKANGSGEIHLFSHEAPRETVIHVEPTPITVQPPAVNVTVPAPAITVNPAPINITMPKQSPAPVFVEPKISVSPVVRSAKVTKETRRVVRGENERIAFTESTFEYEPDQPEKGE